MPGKWTSPHTPRGKSAGHLRFEGWGFLGARTAIYCNYTTKTTTITTSTTIASASTTPTMRRWPKTATTMTVPAAAADDAADAAAAAAAAGATWVFLMGPRGGQRWYFDPDLGDIWAGDMMPPASIETSCCNPAGQTFYFGAGGSWCHDACEIENQINRYHIQLRTVFQHLCRTGGRCIRRASQHRCLQ